MPTQFNTPFLSFSRTGLRRRAATPAAIFGTNLRVWFDNQDLSTMWQDEAMTTPAAVGQGVAMQRCKVNPATFYRSQSTASRRPILRQTAGGVYYLECDGVDDGMVTPALNLGNTDKVAIFAGMQKMSDSSQGMFAELSASYGANNGTFSVQSPPSASSSYMVTSRGTASAIVLYTNTSVAAPHKAVLASLSRISTDTAALRVNGTQVASSPSDQGTGNFGNYPVYYFRRGGSTIPFNGWDFGSFIVDRTPTADEITAAEAWLNRFVGAY